jgi:hypothetical protein
MQDGVEKFGLRIYNVKLREAAKAQANSQKAVELERTGRELAEKAAKEHQCKHCEVHETANAFDHLTGVFGGPVGLLMFMTLADVWNTGASARVEGGAVDLAALIRNIYQTQQPLLNTIKDCTGVKETMNASVTAGGNRVNGF